MKKKIESSIEDQLKQDFMVLLDGCKISFFAEDINYRKDGSLLFYYRKSENSLRVRYDILLGLELKYNLRYQELCDLLDDIAKEMLNVPPIEIEWFEEV